MVKLSLFRVLSNSISILGENKMKNFQSIILTISFLVIALLGSVFEANGQNLLLRSCSGVNPVVKQARIELTKDGDINFVACTGRSVLLNGSTLNGSGTVTSVGLSLPSLFSVTGSPVTSGGTLTASLASQTQNFIFAAPSATNGTPQFRALVSNDLPNLDAAKITTGTFLSSQIPNLDAAKITTGTIGTARLGSGTANNTTFLRGDGTWQTVGTSTLETVSTGLSSYALTDADSGKFVQGSMSLPTTLSVGATYTIISVAYTGQTSTVSLPANTYIYKDGVATVSASATTLTVSTGLVKLTKVNSTAFAGGFWLLESHGSYSIA